jgi:DNA mismatch repair protein MutS
MSLAKQRRGQYSPAMQQYFRAKQQYPDAFVFFRLGDFYEMFFEDAERASQLLDLALTSRGADTDGTPIPMAGIPHHGASSYIARLIAQGHQVAICEQMEDPSKVKGIVPREVVRVITPGLVVDPDALDARAHNYLVAVVSADDCFALSAFEFTTSELRVCTLRDDADLIAELVRLDCREILMGEKLEAIRRAIAKILPRAVVRAVSDPQLEQALSDQRTMAILQKARGESLDQKPSAAEERALALVLKYAQDTQPATAVEVQRISPYNPTDQLVLDDAAVRNLEIVKTLAGERAGSLISLLDKTHTPMGARALRRRILAPLTDIAAIRRRHDSVETLVDEWELRAELQKILAEVGDLERLATRAALAMATPRDLGATRAALAAAGRLAAVVAGRPRQFTDDALAGLANADRCGDVLKQLSETLVDEPPPTDTVGGIFRETFDPRIAELRHLSSSSKDFILQLEAKERTRTGISSLKIRYTRVFGYYIEVTRTHLKSVPSDYRRKQTIATGERYTTDELEALQAEILSADQRLNSLEAELFSELRRSVGAQAPRLRALAATVGDLDVHAALAEVAHRHGYVRPLIDDSLLIDLKEARHPIIEQTVTPGTFVPNDIYLDIERQRLMIITGPNMSGKSTAMRLVAISVIIAQAGGFVPASQARIGLVDRIYTRVGASDDLSRGESTFMVEMRETAAILRGASRRSLVILDEIGRGTSTYDGLAIAWAVAEHLYDIIGCRAMFATHYHELCELAATRPAAVNFNVAAKEYRNEVVFLHKILPGSANRSYGVAVAKLAGVPTGVIARAGQILKELESGAALPSGAMASLRRKDVSGAIQLEMFSPVVSEVKASVSEAEKTLRALEIDKTTPVEALLLLSKLKASLEQEH